MQYMIVTNYRPEDLATEVNKLIKDGWKPQGGISMADKGGMNLTFAQALVKP